MASAPDGWTPPLSESSSSFKTTKRNADLCVRATDGVTMQLVAAASLFLFACLGVFSLHQGSFGGICVCVCVNLLC